MNWTSEKLNDFKNHFGLTDKEIATAIHERTVMVWKMRNGVIPLERYMSRLTGYLLAVKAAKEAEYQSMIEYFKSFE